MRRDIDEALSVKLCCAGMIICNVVMIICLLSHFIHESYTNPDISYFRHYITYSAVCVISIACIYFIERGRRLPWIICVAIDIIALVSAIFDFDPNGFMIAGAIMIVISLILLLMPPVCRKCRIPVLKDLSQSES